MYKQVQTDRPSHRVHPARTKPDTRRPGSATKPDKSSQQQLYFEVLTFKITSWLEDMGGCLCQQVLQLNLHNEPCKSVFHISKLNLIKLSERTASNSETMTT